MSLSLLGRFSMGVLPLLMGKRKKATLPQILANAEQDQEAQAKLPIVPASVLAQYDVEEMKMDVGEGGATWVVFRMRRRERQGGETGRALIHIHGGAFFAQAVPQHFSYCASLLAPLPDHTIYLPIYPLSPAARSQEMQAGLLRVFNRVSGLHQGGVDLSGDSAGGALALTLIYDVLKRDGEGKRVGKVVLLAPVVDLRTTDEERDFSPQDPWLPLDLVEAMSQLWPTQGLSKDDPSVSPIEGVHLLVESKIPVQLYVGKRDLLYPACARMKARVDALGGGNAFEFFAYDGLCHVFQIALPWVWESKEAIRKTIEFLA